MKKSCCIICGKYRKSEKPKISYFIKKKLVLSIICSKCKNEDEILGSINNIEKYQNI